MIGEDEVLEFIRDKFTIEIDKTFEFDHIERIRVKLKLDGEVIDEDYIDLMMKH